MKTSKLHPTQKARLERSQVRLGAVFDEICAIRMERDKAVAEFLRTHPDAPGYSVRYVELLCEQHSLINDIHAALNSNGLKWRGV